MNIIELSKQSGDSKLLSYVYAGGILKVDLELDDPEINVQLLIESDLVYFNHSLLEHPDDIKRTCFIKFVESKGLLGTNNGYFIPSSDFSKVMKECGRFYNILYGSKADIFKYFFSLVGYGTLIACRVENIDDVKILKLK